jgi:hypothetical protein
MQKKKCKRLCRYHAAKALDSCKTKWKNKMQKNAKNKRDRLCRYHAAKALDACK